MIVIDVPFRDAHLVIVTPRDLIIVLASLSLVSASADLVSLASTVTRAFLTNMGSAGKAASLATVTTSVLKSYSAMLAGSVQ